MTFARYAVSEYSQRNSLSYSHSTQYDIHLSRTLRGDDVS